MTADKSIKGNIIDQQNSRWIRCPICKGKTRTKVYASTFLLNFPLFCPKCKHEFLIDVIQFKMVVKDIPTLSSK